MQYLYMHIKSKEKWGGGGEEYLTKYLDTYLCSLVLDIFIFFIFNLFRSTINMTKSQQSTLNIGEAQSQKQGLLTHVTLVMNDFLALRFELYFSDKVFGYFNSYPNIYVYNCIYFYHCNSFLL